MGKLIAAVLVIAHVGGERIQFKPGDEVTGLAIHDVAELKRLGSVRDLADEQASAEEDERKRAIAAKAFAEARAGVVAAQESILPTKTDGDEAVADAAGTAGKTSKKTAKA